MTTPLLQVQELCKYYKAPRGQTLKAVNHVSFSVYPGETLGIVGESGCGKTTCGKTCMGMLRPTGGQVLCRGKNIHTMTRRERFAHTSQAQMIFQDPYSSLDPRQTVYGILAEGIRIHKRASSRAQEQQMVAQLLEQVGLAAHHALRSISEFSGGQRQRIGIARTLSVEPEFLFCDEPVSALDVSVQAQIINLLTRLQQQRHLTMLFVAHDLAIVKHISHCIAVMYLGHLVELSPCHNLYKTPAHPYTQALLAAVPIPDPEIARQPKGTILSGELPSPLHTPTGCPFVTRCSQCTSRCHTQVPSLKQINPGHFVACHLYT